MASRSSKNYMPFNWDQQISNFYLYATRGTSPSVEWAWLIGRLAIAIIAVPTTYATFDGFQGAWAVPIAAVGVVLYSVLLALLLRRGYTKLTFLVGFLLDNIVIVLAWWLTVRSYHPGGADNDLWLILLPITIVGIARTGPMLGLGYVGLMSILLVWITLAYQPSESHAVQQLPVRLVFFGIVGALFTWLVSELNLERETAKELQGEAETLSEISQAIGTSLDPAETFPSVSQLLRPIIPFDVLVFAELNADERILEVLNTAGPKADPLLKGKSYMLPRGTMLFELLTRREPHLLDELACARVVALADDKLDRLISSAKSMIACSIVSGDSVTGTLFAYSARPHAFTAENLRIMARVSELVGASMTNLQVYSQAIQLANERDARLTLDAANRKLQADNEARTFFLSAISHELRTPLTSIIAFNDLVLRNRANNLTPRQLQHLDLIRSNSKHLSNLVEDLLDLSYIGSGKVRLTPQKFSPVEAINQVLTSVMPMIELKRQVIDWSPKETCETIIADRDRFAQIIANIISNATKYSPMETTITLRWTIAGGRFEMSITDHGDGISDDEMTHLFQPFFRAAQHRTNNIPGTGLGLPIVKSLLEAHGGDIDVRSLTNSGGTTGTEVRVWFPVDGSGLTENGRLRKSA